MIAIRFNKISQFTILLVPRRDNSFSYRAYNVIPICSVFYSLTWYFIFNRIIVETEQFWFNYNLPVFYITTVVKNAVIS
jgi:hypothetical protein